MNINDASTWIEAFVMEARKIYPDITVKEIIIGRKKIRVYGSTERLWFKIIIDSGSDSMRVYSNSSTLEFTAKKLWKKRFSR